MNAGSSGYKRDYSNNLLLLSVYNLILLLETVKAKSIEIALSCLTAKFSSEATLYLFLPSYFFSNNNVNNFHKSVTVKQSIYIITWIMHQIFLCTLIKWKSQLAKITITPIHPLYPTSTVLKNWAINEVHVSLST